MTELIQPNTLDEIWRKYRISRRWLILAVGIGILLMSGVVFLCSVVPDERIQLAIIVIGMLFLAPCLLVGGVLYHSGMLEAKKQIRTLTGPQPLTKAGLVKSLLGALMVALSLAYAIFWITWWLLTIFTVGHFDEIAWTWVMLAIGALGISGWVVMQALKFVFANAVMLFR